jgi:hypothetical protein
MSLRRALAAAALILGLSSPALAALAAVTGADEAAPADRPVTVRLHDGSRLLGSLVAQDDQGLTLRLRSGSELRLARADVAAIVAEDEREEPAPADPNATRLLFAPTGRPLPKGDGYFSDHYVLFPGLAVGLTDHLSVGAGISTIPGLGLDEQLVYVAPRLAFDLPGDNAFAVGALYAQAGDADEGGAALAFGVLTLGRPTRSLSVGLGFGGERARTYDYANGARYRSRVEWVWRDAPIVMVGGSVQIGRRAALLSENWLFLGDGFRLDEQPFAVAVRLFGQRLSADVGLVIVPAVLDEGFPLPWLSISYAFGKSRGTAERLSRR